MNGVLLKKGGFEEDEKRVGKKGEHGGGGSAEEKTSFTAHWDRDFSPIDNRTPRCLLFFFLSTFTSFFNLAFPPNDLLQRKAPNLLCFIRFFLEEVCY